MVPWRKMRFVYVLEDDAKFMKEITEALLLADPSVQVRQFRTLAAFADWLKTLIQEGPGAVKKGGLSPPGFEFAPVGEGDEAVLQLVISKVEFLGARQLNLLMRTRGFFIRHQVCTAENPTAFVLTAFEDPRFPLKSLKDRILSNLLIKPFDKLILQQHLTYALDGRHPPSKHAVAPYRTNAVIEVLKSIRMKVLSPVGFTTVSNRMLPPGAVAKYYGRLFMSERHRSIIARLAHCRPVPGAENEFEATFFFFGADPTQISSLRRKVLEAKSKAVPSPLSVVPGGRLAKCRIVFLEDRDEVVQSLEPMLKRKVRGAEIIRYRNLKEFLLELDPKLALDGGSAVKPFGSVPSAQVELDVKGKIIKAEGAAAHFSGTALAAGTAVTPLVRDDDRGAFLNWLAKPAGEIFCIWLASERSFVMKVSHLGKRDFRIEEASATEKEAFARSSSRLAKGWDFLFAGHRFTTPDRLDLWSEILKKARALGGEGAFRSFVLSSQVHSDEEERKLASIFDDLFFVPVERVYVLQKMALLLPEIGILEDPVEVLSIPCPEEIKSARPAEIEEMSEAGLIMKYDRPVSVGSFREFVLWQPYEIDAPEITASANFVEQGPDGSEWKLHFVFFGMKDVLLKAIRSWILDNYVRSKSSA